MPFVAEEQPDEEVFVASEQPDEMVAAVPADAVSPMTDELRPAPTFGQRVGRAIDAFKQTIQPDDFIDAFDPFKFPKAIMAAGEQLSPEGREMLSPIIGPSESQKIAQRQSGAPTSVIETEGLVPGIVGKLSRIEPVARTVEEMKAPELPDDSLLTAAGKATRNVALDVSGAMASPVGVALGGAAAFAPRAAAAAMSPLVVNSIQDTARSFAEDETDQKRIEGVLTSVMGVGGTLAAIKMAPKPGTTTPKKAAPATEIAKEAVEGAAALEKTLGMEAPLSAAERTGAKGMAQREAFVKRIGAGDGTKPLPYQAQQQAVADAVKKAVSEQAEQAGPKAEVGAQVAREITVGEEALRGEVGQAAGKAVQEIASGAEQQVGAVGSKMEATDLGNKIRDSVNFTLDYNKSVGKDLYKNVDDLIQNAAGPKEFVETTTIRNKANQILAEATKRQTATGQREVIPKLLPAYEKIQELASLPNQSFQEIQRLQSLIGQSIGRLQAGAADDFGGGFQLKDLKDLYGAIRQDVDQSLAKLDPKAKDAATKAREFYRQNIETLEQNPILSKLANTTDQGGIANVGEIAGMFARGEGKLQDLQAVKQFLPAADYGDLKAGILNSLRSKNSIPTAAGYVEDLTTFAKDFRSLAPEFQRELMGSPEKAKALQATLDKFAAGKKAVDVLGDRSVAPPETLQALIDDIQAGKAVEGNRKFGEAIAKDAARSRDYFNTITKDIRAGNLGKTKVDPAQFVDDFLLKSDDVNEVRTALQQLSGETRGRVQKLLSQKLFELAIDQENSTVRQILAGQGEVSGQKLIDLFVSDPKRAQIVQAVIPESSKELLTNFIKYQRGIETARKAGGNSGLVSGQARFGGGMNQGVLGIIPQLGESFIKAKVFRGVSEAFFSKPVQEIMALSARGDFLTQAVAAWGLSKMGVNKMPTLPREALGVLNAEVGASKVQEYLDTKEQIDQILANATPEEVDAAMMLIPEVAYPLEVEPQPDEPVVEPEPAPEVVEEVVEAPVAAPEPVPAPQPPKRNVIAPKGTRVRQNGRIYVYDGKEWKPE